MNVQQAIESTKCLNAKEKATLAHCLISSLETKLDEGVEQAWGDIPKRIPTIIACTLPFFSDLSRT